jgi:hypothetical protein
MACCVFLIAFGLLATANKPAKGQDANWVGGAPVDAHVDVREGGVLPYGFAYHRQVPPAAANPTISPQQGWYGYGFPVRTQRWGWFGASHYYPTVLWHRDYYGDCVRWAYRRGY